MKDKNYTSITCFAGASEDMQKQINIGINNKSGKAIMRVTTMKNCQEEIDPKNITHCSITINENILEQLKNIYEYAKNAFDQVREPK